MMFPRVSRTSHGIALETSRTVLCMEKAMSHQRWVFFIDWDSYDLLLGVSLGVVHFSFLIVHSPLFRNSRKWSFQIG